MNTIKKKRRYITLIEIMIVMFLIALITGVLAFNFRGSLDKGKASATEAGIQKLEAILNLAISEHPEALSSLETNWAELVRTSPLVKDPNNVTKDGWGETYYVAVDENQNIIVHSRKLVEYQQKNKLAP